MHYPVWISEDYLVYPDGKVWSELNHKWLKSALSKVSGYLIFGKNVTKVVGGSPTLHRILAHCFKGGIPEGMTVDHLDGDKLNNELDNLEIVTHAENTKRAYAAGLAKGKKGSANSGAKLTEDDAIKVFQCLQKGWSNHDIAKLVNLHPNYISLMRHGKRWKHLYDFYGPFGESIPFDKFGEKYVIYLKMKDTHTNREIAKAAHVDPSTVSRWRSGQTRS
ncbi:winged helix-turn-helix DNA-binding protein [Serratia phage vB_SmaM-Sureiya]|nr:winged helix-turn-helix DNA-binding protein [Serratia phage vB_SmaM-Sureiya]